VFLEQQTLAGKLPGVGQRPATTVAVPLLLTFINTVITEVRIQELAQPPAVEPGLLQLQLRQQPPVCSSLSRQKVIFISSES